MRTCNFRTILGCLGAMVLSACGVPACEDLLAAGLDGAAFVASSSAVEIRMAKCDGSISFKFRAYKWHSGEVSGEFAPKVGRNDDIWLMPVTFPLQQIEIVATVGEKEYRSDKFYAGKVDLIDGNVVGMLSVIDYQGRSRVFASRSGMFSEIDYATKTVKEAQYVHYGVDASDKVVNLEDLHHQYAVPNFEVDVTGQISVTLMTQQGYIARACLYNTCESQVRQIAIPISDLSNSDDFTYVSSLPSILRVSEKYYFASTFGKDTLRGTLLNKDLVEISRGRVSLDETYNDELKRYTEESVFLPTVSRVAHARYGTTNLVSVGRTVFQIDGTEVTTYTHGELTNNALFANDVSIFAGLVQGEVLVGYGPDSYHAGVCQNCKVKDSEGNIPNVLPTIFYKSYNEIQLAFFAGKDGLIHLSFDGEALSESVVTNSTIGANHHFEFLLANDIDGDGESDLLFGNSTNLVMQSKSNEVIELFSRKNQHRDTLGHEPAIVDLDGDGAAELLLSFGHGECQFSKCEGQMGVLHTLGKFQTGERAWNSHNHQNVWYDE